MTTLLYHSLRRAEVCTLRLMDLQDRRGVRHLQLNGKGGKIRCLPTHLAVAGSIAAYLDEAGHGDDKTGALFRLLGNNTRGIVQSITPDGVYKVLAKYAGRVGIVIDGFGPHAVRATAATNALEHDANIAKVQEWLGHANISTTRVYDRCQMHAEDSPSFKVVY